MKLHERFFIVQTASNEFRGLMLDLERKHGLTTGEVVGMLADEIARHAKYAVREERHGTTDKKGDEA